MIPVLNGYAQAPTISSNGTKAEPVIECSLAPEPIKCTINRVLEPMGEIDLSGYIYELASCENSFREKGCGDGGLSCGFLQFQEPTWKTWKCEGSRESMEDSTRCAVKLINAGVGHTTAGWKNCWAKRNLEVIERSEE